MTNRTNARIIFKKLRIKNFGPFMGDNHEIFFSFDRDKNVTLIIGDQESGKSTIFQLIYWLLFPCFEINDMENEIRFLRSKDIKKTVNNHIKKQLEDGDTIQVGGSIEFEYEDRSGNSSIYEIERYIEYIKKSGQLEYNGGDIKQAEIKRVFHNSSPLAKPDDVYFNLLFNYFPEAVREFVFIFGEDLTRILSEKNIGKLKDYSLDISDYPKIKALSVYFDKAIDYFDDKHLDICAQNDEQNKKKKEIEKFRKQKSEKLEEKIAFEEKLNKIIVDINKFRSEREQIKDKIGFVKAYNQKKKKLEECEKDKIKIVKRREEIMMQYLPLIYLEKTMEQILDDIRDKREKNLIPGRLNSEILNIIKNRPSSCICGNPWNSEMIRNIENLISKSESSKKGETAIKFEGEIETKLRAVKEGKKKILSVEAELVNINRSINDIKREIEKLELNLSEEEKNEIWYQSVKKLDEKIEKAKKMQGQYEEKIEQISKEINNIEQKIKTETTSFKKLVTRNIGKKDESEKMIKCRELSAFYKKVIDEIKKDVAEQIRLKCEENTLKSVKRLASNPENYLRITIRDTNEGWDIIASTNLGEEISNTSTGQTNIIGMAFISSLAEILDINLPLIFDSPFSNLGSKTREQVVKNLPDMYKDKQVIFFVKPSNMLIRNSENIIEMNGDNITDLFPILEEKVGIRYFIESSSGESAQLVRR